MSELPKGWVITNLGEVCSKPQYGYTTKADPSIGKVKYVRTTDITSGRLNWSTTPFCQDAPDDLKKFQLNIGDLLIARSGSVGVSYLIDEKYEPAVFASYLIRFTPFSLINNRFIKRYLESPYFIMQVDLNKAGNALQNINAQKLSAISVPLAPQAEQTRIVEKLDEVLAQVDTIKARLDGIPAILKRFRQSVLAAAVSGRLTEEWRKDKTNLIENDLTKYSTKKFGAVSNNEYFDETPPSWNWIKLGAIVHLINGDRGKNYPNKSEYVENGIPFINTGHIEPNGSLSVARMNYISEDKFNTLGSGKIAKNDIVYCLRGATMGKTAIVNPLEKGAIASSLVIVRAKECIHHKFCYYYLISPQAKQQIIRFDNGSAQPNLSANSLGLYPISLPSLDEQKEIVLLVDQYFAFADTIESQVKKAQARVDNLTQSILAKAFRGELVAQDPSDEPAEKLLERIAQARKEAEALAKAAKKVAKTK